MESFVVEGVSIERELVPLITSDIGVYGKQHYLLSSSRCSPVSVSRIQCVHLLFLILNCIFKTQN